MKTNYFKFVGIFLSLVVLFAACDPVETGKDDFEANSISGELRFEF